MTVVEATESHAALIARARELVPSLRDRARSAERERAVPGASLADLREAGLLDLTKPRRYGGAAGSLTTTLRVSRELASGCLSTAWVQGVFSGHLLFLGHFPLTAQETVYEDPDALVAAVLRLGGSPARRTSSGFRLVGAEGRFCSGVDLCTWLLVGAEVEDEDRHFFLLPRADVEVIDDWDTMAMRATGSKSIRIRDVHIPADRAVSYASMVDGTSPGGMALDEPFFRGPADVFTPYSLIGNPIGGAYAALEAATGSVSRKHGALDALGQAGQSGVLARLGEAAATLDAAYGLVLRDVEQLDACEGPSITPYERTRLLRNRAYAAQTSRRVVNDLFELSGGSALYDASPIQRWWRDVNGACNHVGMTWDPAMTGFARAALGGQSSVG